jgi:hypothetical protein
MGVLLVLVLQEVGTPIEQLPKQLPVIHIQVASMGEHAQPPEANAVAYLILIFQNH